MALLDQAPLPLGGPDPSVSRVVDARRMGPWRSDVRQRDGSEDLFIIHSAPPHGFAPAENIHAERDSESNRSP